MINANELRIDNRVNDDQYDRVVFVTGIGPTFAQMWVNSADGQYRYWQQPDMLSGIELSIDILEKLGFTFGDWSDHDGHALFLSDRNASLFVNLNTNSSSIGKNFYHSSCDNCCDTSYFLADIKYLHQLQNLYFSLTGEELDVSKIVNK